MKNKLFNKITLFILFILTILAGIKLYTNYQSTNEVVVENVAKSDFKDNMKSGVVENIKVMIYSKNGCSYCTRAKILLERKGIPYEEVELTNKNDLIIKLIEQTGQTTVPYIFIDDKFIGGYQDLFELNKENKL